MGLCLGKLEVVALEDIKQVVIPMILFELQQTIIPSLILRLNESEEYLKNKQVVKSTQTE